MKTNILLLVAALTLMAANTFAQDEMYNTVAQETCLCINQKNVLSKSRKEIEMALGLCIFESINKHKIDVDISDESAMEAYGQKIGIRMAGICPEVFQAFVTEEATPAPTTPTLKVSGKIKAIEEGTLLTFVLREDSGKEHKLVWYGYFAGSDEYKENPKLLIGKQVTFSYKEVETFFPKAKTYINNKEIISLDSVK
ncbi:MAG: hypothetical protein MUF68_07095 [Cyclobacteriaceae bacterium]|jgi:hypothetical protein|nr:hypothetical protein [Cyclobacteriaceae bacterium]